ncbi:protein of unknown function (DU1801) [Devosia sp. YR412]|uniref:DUF1801 domain-containing protein n=1 Tax=Devosia sp. YR412 TaxID=1881030 RepID=UPI0008CE0635|nr:DUF1801 domain-containing protein [Devosia sp. YR412]SEP68091.1 protein of unknown function (DU1801) [Devosia sp. YR412]
MAVAEKLSAVDSYMDELQHGRKAEIETLRRLILDAVPDLNERIKWNAPSFGKGEDDRITMRIHPGDRLQLILHRGAKAGADDLFRFEDPEKLIAWAAPDRGVVTFKDAEDLAGKSVALPEILRRWVACTTR